VLLLLQLLAHQVHPQQQQQQQARRQLVRCCHLQVRC
jgi:hypothetical protein